MSKADVAQLSDAVAHFLSCLVSGADALETTTSGGAGGRKKGKAKDRGLTPQFSSALTSEVHTPFACSPVFLCYDVRGVPFLSFLRSLTSRNSFISALSSSSSSSSSFSFSHLCRMHNCTHNKCLSSPFA
jgi:hypothetical protein